jgi:hypothetical protein
MSSISHFFFTAFSHAGGGYTYIAQTILEFSYSTYRGVEDQLQ